MFRASHSCAVSVTGTATAVGVVLLEGLALAFASPLITIFFQASSGGAFACSIPSSHGTRAARLPVVYPACAPPLQDRALAGVVWEFWTPPKALLKVTAPIATAAIRAVRGRTGACRRGKASSLLALSESNCSLTFQ